MVPVAVLRLLWRGRRNRGDGGRWGERCGVVPVLSGTIRGALDIAHPYGHMMQHIFIPPDTIQDFEPYATAVKGNATTVSKLSLRGSRPRTAARPSGPA